ncbi:MAG: GNAT family N-acetyltransferase [Microterricola sp.]
MSAPVPPGPQIVTKRLLLRRWTEADRAPFARMNADPAVMEHFPSVLDAAASDALIARIEAGFERTDVGRGAFGLWAVERLDSGQFIGFVGLAVPGFTAHFTSPRGSEPGPAVEIGWRLAADAWGNGFASEAAAAVLEYGFGTLGLDEIVSFTARSNVRSQRVMERIGMVRDTPGDFSHPALPADHALAPHVLYRARRSPESTVIHR